MLCIYSYRKIRKQLKAHSLQKGDFPENFALFVHFRLMTEELRLQNQ